MKFHPIAELFPLLPEGNLKALAHDIATTGQVGIAIAGTDVIGDGRNRWLACQRNGIAPLIGYRAFADDAAIAGYVMAKNIHRRHLSLDQRAALAVALAAMSHGGDGNIVARDQSVR